MQQTSNYALNKPEQTDVVNIEDLNTNFDTIDTELKKVSDKANLIQTAGGTGTAISLKNISLVSGFTITFVVAANNNGAATTINGKALYKPGGTAAPTLTAGKAVTVWYSGIGDNFFIKASAEGNSVAADVLAGKTFSNDADTGLTGTMPNNGAVSQSLGINGTYNIPAGYHNGSGKVTQSITTKGAATYNPSTSAQTITAGQYLSGAQTIAATTGTSAVSDVLSGKTFNSASGIGLTGTMPNNGSVGIQTLTTEGAEYTIPSGCHNGLGKVRANITGLIASVIKAGTTVGGISGTFTSDATATSSQILNGVTAYVSGNKVAGAMANNGAVSHSLAINSTYKIPAGYHSGGGEVTQSITTKGAATYNPSTSTQTIAAGQYLSGTQTIAGDPNLVAAYILSGASIFGVNGAAKRVASGTVSSGSGGYLTYADGSSPEFIYYGVTVSGLNFTPSFILIINDATYSEIGIYKYHTALGKYTYYDIININSSIGSPSCYHLQMNAYFYVNSTGFKLPAASYYNSYRWLAVE